MAKGTKKIVEGRSKQQRKTSPQEFGKVERPYSSASHTPPICSVPSPFVLGVVNKGGASACLQKPPRWTTLSPTTWSFCGQVEKENRWPIMPLAALQDHDPNLKKKLPGSWRLMKAWNTAEIPNRAPPLTLTCSMLYVVGVCSKTVLTFGLSLRVAFFGLLRTGELLSVRARDVYLTGPPKGPAVISLGLTKSGARQGAAESVTIHDSSVLPGLYQWKCQANHTDFLTVKPHAWRRLFNRKPLRALSSRTICLPPVLPPKGGATFFFQHHGSFDRLLIQGRWGAAKTARIYLERRARPAVRNFCP